MTRDEAELAKIGRAQLLLAKRGYSVMEQHGRYCVVDHQRGVPRGAPFEVDADEILKWARR